MAVGHGLDGHYPNVPLRAQRQQFLGRLPVAGKTPQRRVDREHHRVEVEAAESLEKDHRDIEVVTRDTSEARLAARAKRQDTLQGARSAVQLLQRGHRVGLVEVQDIGVEEPPGGVELLLHPVGIRPQGLARHEQIRPMRRQVRPDHGLGRPVLRRDVQMVDPPAQRQLQPRPRLVRRGPPAGRPAENGDTALVARSPPTAAVALRRQLRRHHATLSSCRDGSTVPDPGGRGRAGLPTMPPMSFVEVTTPQPHVALVTLNRPERMNAMAFDVMIPFRDRLREIGYDNDVRVVVITGAGHGFCSGADLEDPGTIPNVEGLTLPTMALRSMELLDDVISTIRRLHQPVIAAINGPAIGGGFCLALSADIRIAADSAYFRAAGINNGLTAAELGISFLLPRSVGQTRASEIMLTGRDVSAEEADRIGLVSSVVPGDALLLRTSYETAARIIGWSRPGIELTKRQLWNSLDASSLQTHMDAEGQPSCSSVSPRRTSRSRSAPAGRSAPRSSWIRERLRSGSVDQRVGCHVEVGVQLFGIRGRQPVGLDHAVDGAAHVPKPRITLCRSDDERGVPHAQPGVTPRLVVRRRTAPVLHEEKGQVAT